VKSLCRYTLSVHVSPECRLTSVPANFGHSGMTIFSKGHAEFSHGIVLLLDWQCTNEFSIARFFGFVKLKIGQLHLVLMCSRSLGLVFIFRLNCNIRLMVKLMNLVLTILLMLLFSS
jgi:hypothetical protein